jgi:hypothetical protein
MAIKTVISYVSGTGGDFVVNCSNRPGGCRITLPMVQLLRQHQSKVLNVD